jgi:hypothetical protein
MAIDGINAWDAHLEARHVDHQFRARWRHALLPTPAHNGVARGRRDDSKSFLELTMVSAGSGSGDYPLTLLKTSGENHGCLHWIPNVPEIRH